MIRAILFSIIALSLIVFGIDEHQHRSIWAFAFYVGALFSIFAAYFGWESWMKKKAETLVICHIK